jgi:hypothetical protein
MKANKFLLLTLAFLLFMSFNKDNCDTLTYLQKGNEWTLTQFDKKGKETGRVTYIVLDKRTTSDGVEWDIQSKMLDNKDNEMSDITATASCDGKAIRMDMSQMMPPQTLEGLSHMDLEIEADDIVYPFNIAENMELPDAKVTIRVSSGGLQIMEMTSIIKDRKVVQKETITTGAGDFEAYKLEQTVVVKNRIMSSESKSIDWYCPNIGVVRSEFFDKKGRPDGYSELTAFTKAN